MAGGERPDDPAVAADVLHRLIEDRAAGGVRALAVYQSMWPGHEELVAREYALAAGGGEPAGDDIERVGAYRLERELGRGGQGTVWLAVDERLGRRVALKLLDRLQPGAHERLARFQREAEVASRLDHPGICQVLESGVEGDRAFIAMRYVEGSNLAEILRAERVGGSASGPTDRASISRRLELFESAARALHAAHEVGVVHRDVKPENLAVTPDGEPVWLDFGLARDDEERAALTVTGDVFGTPAYMSPEQLSGRGPRLDRRTDVYSLGATMFEALCGVPPFTAPTREALYRSILQDEAPRARARNPELPEELGDVLAVALEKDPDRRYGTAADLAEDLRRVRMREPILARPPGALVRAVRWVQRNALVSALAGGLVVALAAGLVVSNHYLRESEDARAEIARQLDDVMLGRAEKHDREVQRRLERGFQHAMGVDVPAAAEAFDSVLALEPEHVAARIGRAWLEIPDADAALVELDRHGPALDPPDVAWARGFFLRLAGRAGEAARQLELAGPAESDLRLYLRGLDAVDSFRPPVGAEAAREAHALFRRAIARSRAPQFHYVHGALMAAASAGDADAMETAAADLEYLWPDAPATHEAIAQFYFTRDRPRAERAMRRQLELEPAPAPCLGLAQLAALDGRAEEARQWYDRAVDYGPELAAPRYMRALFARSEGRAEAAREDLLAGLSAEPGHVPLYVMLEEIDLELGGVERAREDLLGLARALPAEPLPLLRLGELELSSGDAARAADTFARACERAPDAAAPIQAWSRALEASLPPAEVARALGGFLERHPGSARGWIELARVERSRGQRAAAILALETALRIRPHDDDLRAELDGLRGG